MSINERVKAVLEQEHNQTVFAKKTGLTTATVSRMVNHQGQIKSDTIEAILQAYPTLNARWLLTGQSPMWLDQAPVDDQQNSQVLLEEIEDLRRKLEEKDAFIDRISRMMEDRLRLLENLIVQKAPELAKELGLVR